VGTDVGDLRTLNPTEPIAPNHDLTAFASGEPTLDDWLRRRARANQISGASRTYVAAQAGRVVGYYSLSSGAVAVAEAPSRARRNMPDPVPVAVLGRLAVDRTWQGQGLGTLLLRDAILRTSRASEIIGMRGLLVHALTPAAQGFYERNGFRVSPVNPMMLVVTLRDALAACTREPS
jgi:GNAT superfamily N-acetyltransferase